MKYYIAEVLALKGIKEDYLIMADTIGDAEDKAYQMFQLRHPKKSTKEIISMEVYPKIFHAVIHY